MSDGAEERAGGWGRDASSTAADRPAAPAAGERAKRSRSGAQSDTFDHVDTIRPKRIWDGVVARFVQSELITMAIVELEPNSVVPEHHHVNEQLGFVIEGSVTFTVGGETERVGPGGTWRILADIPHHVQVGPDGATVAEVYSPVRADWAALDDEDPVPARWPSRA